MLGLRRQEPRRRHEEDLEHARGRRCSMSELAKPPLLEQPMARRVAEWEA